MDALKNKKFIIVANDLQMFTNFDERKEPQPAGDKYCSTALENHSQNLSVVIS